MLCDTGESCMYAGERCSEATGAPKSIRKQQPHLSVSGRYSNGRVCHVRENSS